jgi:hypothetical protein
MKRLACIIALGVGITTAGCTAAGDDVYVEAKTGSSQSSLGCQIQPGEYVCTRPFEMLDSVARPGFVSVASAAAEFAGIAEEGRRHLSDACLWIIDALGAKRPVLDTSLSGNAWAIAYCDVALGALAAYDRSAVTIAITAGTCSDVPPVSCASGNAAPRKQCAASTFEVAPSAAATSHQTDVARVLAQAAAFAVDAKARLTALAALSSDVTRNSDRLADVSGPGASACVSAVTTLVTTGTEDSKTMASLSAKLVEAIGPQL